MMQTLVVEAPPGTGLARSSASKLGADLLLIQQAQEERTLGRQRDKRADGARHLSAATTYHPGTRATAASSGAINGHGGPKKGWTARVEEV